MNKKDLIVSTENINEYIYIIRGQKVILDRDLAELYGVPTGRLNEQVRRNIKRFPIDFMFQLSKSEFDNWKSQIAISNPSVKMGLRKHPYAFSEQGVAMLSSVLHSERAIQVNVEIIRVFVKLRHALHSHEKLSKEMMELKSFVLKNSHQTDKEFKKIWNTINKLTKPPKNIRKIGFNLNQ